MQTTKQYIGCVMTEWTFGSVPLHFTDLAHAERLITIIHAMQDPDAWVGPGWLEVWGA